MVSQVKDTCSHICFIANHYIKIFNRKKNIVKSWNCDVHSKQMCIFPKLESKTFFWWKNVIRAAKTFKCALKFLCTLTYFSR